MSIIIKVTDLSKVFKIHKKEEGFRGSLKALFKREYVEKKALSNVSFNVSEGEIIGVLGANGAGKTTLLKMLTGIINPSEGSVEVLNYIPWERNNNFRKQISLIMGQKAQLWWDLPAADCFLLLKEIYQIPTNDYQEMLDELCSILNVKHLINIQLRQLSLGERMKMELIASLLHKPKVLFLDEPTIGLDVSSQYNIREFIIKYIEKYRPAVILTSHYMEDIESLCKRVLIIKEGELVYDGKLDKIMKLYSPYKVVKVHFENLENFKKNPDPLSAFGNVIINDHFIEIKVLREDITKIINLILENYPIIDLTIEEVNSSLIIDSVLKNIVNTSV